MNVTAALYVEARKSAASMVMRSVTVLVLLGISVLCGALVAGAMSGNEEVLSQLGHLSTETGWPLLTGIVAQITGAAGILAAGVALSWMFGREFADRTITGLFGQPTSRVTIAAAKFIIFGGWLMVVALVLTILVLLSGFILQLGSINGEVLSQLRRQFFLVLLSGLLATPAAWASTLGRGILPGVAVTIGLIATAQVAGIISRDAAGWIPIAAPALWSLFPNEVTVWQLSTALVIPALFGVLTIHSWKTLQLDH